MKTFKNQEAEAVLINQMIIAPDIIPNVYDIVKPEAFHFLQYKTCYEALIKLTRSYRESDKIIDELSFRDAVRGKVTPEVINEVTNKTATAANYAYFADQIRKNYISTRTQAVLQESLDKLTDQNGEVVINEVFQKSSEITDDVTSVEIASLADACAAYGQQLLEAVENHRECTGIPSGLGNLNRITGGIQDEYIVIAARPSMGKTALGQQIAMYMSGCFGNIPLEEERKVFFMELEMAPKQIVERGIANISHVPIDRLRSGMLTTEQVGKISSKLVNFSNNPNFIIGQCLTRNISDITNAIRAQVRNNGVQVAFIDHLGLVKSAMGYRSDWESFKEISHTIQCLQRELGIPIIVLSQVGRESEGKENSLASLRGSGAIEEDADTVIFIERERATSPDELHIKAKLVIKKNRNGPCGSAEVIFCPKEVMFVDDKGQFDNEQTPDMQKAEAYARKQQEQKVEKPSEVKVVRQPDPQAVIQQRQDTVQHSSAIQQMRERAKAEAAQKAVAENRLPF